MKTFGTLAATLSLVVVAATHAHASSDLTLIPLSDFSADGKPMDFALPNTGGAGSLAKNGVLTFRGKQHQLDPEQKDPVVQRYAMRAEGGTLYFVLEYANPEKTDKSPWYYLAFAAIDIRTNEIAWRTRVWNRQADKGWELAEAPNTTFFVRTKTGAYAIAKNSGRFRWIFDTDAHGSSLNERFLLSWKFVDKSIVFDAVSRVDFEMYHKPGTPYEIDAATGLRVYRATPRPKFEPHPLYVYQMARVEYRGDRRSAKLPETFDGLVLERTQLVWSKTTGEGIIINPTEVLVPEILALAKKQRANGKPIQWKYVINIDEAAKTFPPDRMRRAVLEKYKDPFIGADGLDEILYWPLGEWWNTGEKIVAADVAKKLGAATLPTPTPERTQLAAAPLFFFRDDTVHHRASISDDDIKNHIKMKWGPYVFYQRSREPTWLKMEPTP